MAGDAWNSRDVDRVAMASSANSTWRNRAGFPVGRDEIRAFLQRKWARELEYWLIKELWAFDGHRSAVRIAYQRQDAASAWCRSYGNGNWEFDDHGLMRALCERQRPPDQ